MGDYDGHPFRGNQYTGGTSDPATMRGSEITREMARLDATAHSVNQAFIAQGRGNELPTERKDKTDPASVTYRAVASRQMALLVEIMQRAGPGTYKLPRGVGAKPRKMGWTPAKDVGR